MRVVVDTNVIVSALMKPASIPAQVLDAVLSAKVVPLFDDRILCEYREVLARKKFGIPPAEIQVVLGFVEAFGEYSSGQRLDLVLRDPTDLPFLEVAVGGLADFFITGNMRDFRPTKGHHNVKVCTPAEFVRII